MAWAALPLLALLFGLANHSRGRGMLPGGRVACAVACGIATGCVASLVGFPLRHAATVAVVITLGTYNWLLWGWGLYFAAFTWRWTEGEKEVGWIDTVCLKLVPFRTADVHWTNGLRGVIGMALRGIYLIPMFLLLIPFCPIMWKSIWWLGLLGSVQGVIYAANRISNLYARAGTAYPELVVGMFVGTLSGFAVALLASPGACYG